MIGEFQIQLGAEQLVSGQSSSDFATDGALGNTSIGINPFVTPGIIRGTLNAGDTSTNLVDNAVASSEDATGNLNARLMVGSAANYYTIDTNGNITKVFTGSDTSNYVSGRTDIDIQSNNAGIGNAFVTHGTDIAMWNGSTTVTESWWTTIAYKSGTTHPSALTANPHPLLNYNTNLWVADGSQLHNIIPDAAIIATPSICVNVNVFSLDLFTTIYALGIDPATGLMLISFQDVTNQGDTISSKYFVGLYDGYSTALRRKIPVDDLVTAFQNVGGVVYVTYGPKIGMWNGNGITFLRRLMNVANTSSTLLYKHRVSNISNVLLVADGQTLLAYGEPVGGRTKTWFNIGISLGAADKITCISPLGNNIVGIFNLFTVGSIFNLRRYDLSSPSGTSFQLAYNNIYFPRPIFVRRMRVITTGIPHSGFTDITASILDEKNNALPISAAKSSVVVPTGTTYVVDFDYSSGKCQGIAISLGASGIWGLVRVIVYYDISE